MLNKLKELGRKIKDEFEALDERERALTTTVVLALLISIVLL